ncbi:MAG: GNAT family N-acetyltransferase [Deltaproteobacteria bacterium]|nr:GNAT family N-acetyltransferase [Deltaproteobacteria bacterium]
MRDLDDLHEELSRACWLSRVALGGEEERAWLDCDLASLAENRLSELADPRAFDGAIRADLERRATTKRPWPLAQRSEFERCYWLVEEGARTGTLAIATATLGTPSVRISSFFVLPSCRGRRVGHRAIERLRHALAPHGLGIRLDAFWCSPRSVRFYLAAGFWVWGWKRDLTFAWRPRLPPPRIEVGQREASLSAAVSGPPIVLASAEHDGHALTFRSRESELEDDPDLGEAAWHSSSTLALALALNGWPLVRSQEHWDRERFSDASAPESLARKIQVWEAWAAKHGWRVETPRIAGLEYPTWDELEAQWKESSR